MMDGVWAYIRLIKSLTVYVCYVSFLYSYSQCSILPGIGTREQYWHAHALAKISSSRCTRKQ